MDAGDSGTGSADARAGGDAPRLGLGVLSRSRRPIAFPLGEGKKKGSTPRSTGMSSKCRSARVRLSRTPSSRGGSPSPPVRRPGSWTRPSSEDSSARTGEASRPRRRAQADCRRARHRERSRATDDVLEPPRVAGADFSKLRKAQKLETFDAPAPIFRTRLRQTAGVFKICAAADRARPHAGATTHGTRGPGFGAAASRPVAIRAEARRLAERRGGCLPSSSARRSSYIGTRPIALRSEDEPRPDEPNPESRVGR